MINRNEYLKKIIDIDNFNEDILEEKEDLFCDFCGKLIHNEYYLDKIDFRIYCSKECYKLKIEEKYF